VLEQAKARAKNQQKINRRQIFNEKQNIKHIWGASLKISHISHIFILMKIQHNTARYSTIQHLNLWLRISNI